MRHHHVAPRPQRGLYRHRLDVLSLLFGLLFVAAGLTVLLGLDVVTSLDPGLAVAVLAMVGGVGVIGSLLVGRGRPATPPPPAPAPEPPAPLLTAEQVRAEDAEWFARSGPLTTAEREVLDALHAEEDPDR